MPFNEELEPSLEELRVDLLVGGMESELNTELARSAMNLFGPLQQSMGGKIRAGSLTETRREAYLDLVKAQAPYFDWVEMEKAETQEVVQSEDEERKKFMDDYQKWVNTGSSPKASKLQYSTDGRR